MTTLYLTVHHISGKCTSYQLEEHGFRELNQLSDDIPTGEFLRTCTDWGAILVANTPTQEHVIFTAHVECLEFSIGE